MPMNEIDGLDPNKSMCPKCQRLLKNDQFYLRKDGSHLELCKQCLTMHINNFEPETFTWILQDLNVPYIPEEWNVLRDRAFAKDPNKMNGMSVIGRYLAKMRLKLWKEYTWEDTERLQTLREEKRESERLQRESYEKQLKEDFENGQISEAQYRTMVSTNKQWEEHVNTETYDPVAGIAGDNMFQEKDFISEKDLPDPAAELTNEDKIYLAMKWGRLYKANEWIDLEKKYVEYSKTANMDDPDTTSTLILLSKTYLKMNQAIDCGDVDGYQKLSKVYDAMRKSLNLTAVQNKEERTDFVDCIGNLVVYCEKEGGRIPRYDLSVDYDILDKEIKDMKQYNKDLIYQDTSLARQIEDYIKQRKIAEEMKEDKKKAKEAGEEAVQVTDEDIVAHVQMLRDMEEYDNQRQSDMEEITSGGLESLSEWH